MSIFFKILHYDNNITIGAQHYNNIELVLIQRRGWSSGAMVLGKLPGPGRPTNLGLSRARAYCACSR